jgi:hypothetical protein
MTIDFSGVTDTFYDVFGVSATHTSDGSSTDCTVLYERKGEEMADRGVVETAVIRVRTSEVATPRRGDTITVNGRTWRVEFLLGADEGTNEDETALSCTATTHMGVS